MAWIGGAIAAAGAIAGSMMSSSSASEANDTNINLNQANRDWQERMSNTQYQRSMADMQSAGLNPMLAFKNGGAGVPTTSAASVSPTFNPSNASDISKAATSAGDSYQSWQTQQTARQLTSAQTAKTQADTANALASADNIQADTALKRSQESNVTTDTQKKGAEWRNVDADTANKEASTPNISRTLALINSEISRNTSSAANLGANTKLLGAQLPKAINEANAESSGFKKNVSPYLQDAATISGAVRNLSSVGR